MEAVRTDTDRVRSTTTSTTSLASGAGDVGHSYKVNQWLVYNYSMSYFVIFTQQNFLECRRVGCWGHKDERYSIPALMLFTFSVTQHGDGRAGEEGDEVYVPSVEGARRPMEFIQPGCVRKGVTEAGLFVMGFEG